MDETQKFLEEMYREKFDSDRVMVVFTPLELEQLNNLLSLGMQDRKSSLVKEARRKKRKLNRWERHLLKADRSLWQKIRNAEKIAFKEEG